MKPMVAVYAPRASALHAARAAISAAFCAAFALVGMLYQHPLVLLAAFAGVLAAAAGARVGGELLALLRLALPFALFVALVNPLVSQRGETLLIRGGDLLGRRFDVTLEALAYGGVAGLRTLVIVVAFGLFSVAVDPDEMLGLFRRLSYRTALTGSITTRLVSVLATDGARMREAARCRAVPARRGAVARATLSGALDRAVAVAAALEVRGYATAQRPARARRPWSRHDLRVSLATALLLATAVAGVAAGVGGFEPYPRLDVELGLRESLLAGVVVGLAVAPFAGASARLGVGRG